MDTGSGYFLGMDVCGGGIQPPRRENSPGSQSAYPAAGWQRLRGRWQILIGSRAATLAPRRSPGVSHAFICCSAGTLWRHVRRRHAIFLCLVECPLHSKEGSKLCETSNKKRERDIYKKRQNKTKKKGRQALKTTVGNVCGGLKPCCDLAAQKKRRRTSFWSCQEPPQKIHKLHQFSLVESSKAKEW